MILVVDVDKSGVVCVVLLVVGVDVVPVVLLELMKQDGSARQSAHRSGQTCCMVAANASEPTG